MTRGFLAPGVAMIVVGTAAIGVGVAAIGGKWNHNRAVPDAPGVPDPEVRRRFLVVPGGETLPVVLLNYIRFDLDGVARLDRWQRGRPGGHGTRGDQPGQIGHGQVRAHRLDPGPADEQMDQVGVGPEADDLTGPSGPEPELPAGKAASIV